MEDYSGTTPFGYAIKNGHEDLCIFIMQNKGFKVPKSIPKYSISKESPYVGLNFLLNNVVSLSEFELLKERKKLFLSSEKVKFEKGYSTQESHSPIYYAIEKNMTGVLYMLMESGFEDISNLFDALELEEIQWFLNLVNKSNILQIKNAKNKVKAALQLMNEIITSKKPKFKSK